MRWAQVRLAMLALLIMFMCGGCPDPLCEGEPPGLQVDLELATGASTEEIQGLEADISAAGMHKTVSLAIAPLKANRRAAFVVEVGDAGKGGFEVKLSVTLLGAGSVVLARGQGTFSASGDACNFFSLTLDPVSTHDGGPDGDMSVDSAVLDAPNVTNDSGCAPPLEKCGGICVDTSSDKNHCGKCDNPCAAKWTCVSGSCACNPATPGSCISPGLHCNGSSGECDYCDKSKFNCDLKGGCECVGKCVGTTCDSSCTYGQPGQCGNIYQACLSSGVCGPCPSGMKNCDRGDDCETLEGDFCP